MSSMLWKKKKKKKKKKIPPKMKLFRDNSWLNRYRFVKTWFWLISIKHAHLDKVFLLRINITNYQNKIVKWECIFQCYDAYIQPLHQGNWVYNIITNPFQTDFTIFALYTPLKKYSQKKKNKTKKQNKNFPKIKINKIAPNLKTICQFWSNLNYSLM
jgi:hypothetical protein